MAKDRYPEIQAALENAVDKLDMDGVLYRLTQIAVSKRDEGEKGGNPAEEAYWQKAIRILSDTQDQISDL